MLIGLKYVYIQRLHAMSQMKNQKKRPNAILINQLYEFRDDMIFMIIHEHQFSFVVGSRIRIIDIMLQKHLSDFIKNEIIEKKQNSRFIKQIERKSIDHHFMILHDQKKK